MTQLSFNDLPPEPMPTTKLDALKDLSFGQRVAEEEIAELSRYFVETDQWRRLFAGEIDIVYGLKGSGKSALYATLINNAIELDARGILLIAGENPRGAPVFKDLVEDPPTSQAEFRALWKLYLLQLLGERFREEQFGSLEAREFVSRLEGSRLLPRGGFRGGVARGPVSARAQLGETCVVRGLSPLGNRAARGCLS